MQAHGAKPQDGEQPALGPGPHLLPWLCLGMEGLLPEWDVLLFNFHPGVTTLPQTKDEEKALQSRALLSLSGWVLSRSVRYQPSRRSYR